MKAAGFWRRFASSLLNTLLIGVTLGIYGIVMIVWFLMGVPNLGMRALLLKYEPGKGRMLILFLFNILNTILYGVTLGIWLIIDFFRICLKKGTWAEKWAKNYIIKNV